MSLALSINLFPGPQPAEHLDRTVKPLPEPTSTQQMHQLEGSGENINQIAANLGVTVASVDSTLGYSISTDTRAGSAQTSIIAAGASVLIPPLDARA